MQIRVEDEPFHGSYLAIGDYITLENGHQSNSSDQAKSKYICMALPTTFSMSLK